MANEPTDIRTAWCDVAVTIEKMALVTASLAEQPLSIWESSDVHTRHSLTLGSKTFDVFV